MSNRFKGLRLNGSNRDDILNGGRFDDILNGGRGDDWLFGDAGNDRLEGGEGDDELHGGSGKDKLKAGSGDDLADGGAGSDDVELGSGNDVAIYRLSENAGARDKYDGGSGHDTLRLEFTASEWASAAVQADVARFRAFLVHHNRADGDDGHGHHDDDDHGHDGEGGHRFQFTAFELEVRKFEAVRVFIDGVEVNPGGTNQPPVAVSDAASGNEDTAITTGNVLANDSDPDNTLTAASIIGHTQGANGAVVYNNNGTFTYTPNPNFNGSDGFSYTISDGALTSTATVSITVSPLNDAPVATDGLTETDEETPLTFVPLGIFDADSSILTTELVGPGLPGLTIDPSGAFNYDPRGLHDDLRAGMPRELTFQFRVSDGDLVSEVATQTIRVVGVNDPPQAVHDNNIDPPNADAVIESSTLAGGDSSAVGNVLTNDPDEDVGDSKLVTGVRAGTAGAFLAAGSEITGVYGNLTVQEDGSYQYHLLDGLAATDALNGDREVEDVFSYRMSDGAGIGSEATIRITVTGANDPAAIGDPSDALVVEDESAVTLIATGTIPIADVDFGEALLQTTVGTAPGNLGTLVLAADGYSYSVANAAVQYLGESQTRLESFTVTAFDGTAKEVTFTISGVNDPPVAADDDNAGDAVTESGVNPGNDPFAGDLSATGNVLANDTDVDAGDTMTVTTTGTFTGTYGSLTMAANGGWTYTLDNADPDTDALAQDAPAQDVFSYTMRDTTGATSSATLTINIAGTNDAPVAAGDSNNGAEENHPIVIGVEDLTGTIPPVGPSELFTLTPLSTFTESGQVHFPFQLSLPSPAAGDTLIQTILTGNASSFLLVGSTTIPAGSTSIGFEVVSNAVVPGGIATSMLAASLGGGSVSATLNVFDGGGGAVSGGGTAVDPDVPASVTETGLITFSDVDLSDMHLVSPNGTPVGTALGTLSAVIGTDTTGSGTGGAIVWTYSAPAAALQDLLPDETRIDRFTITLDDQHGSQITRTVEVALNSNGVEENHPIVIGVEDLTGTIPPVGPSELFTLTPLSTFTESGQVHFPFQLSLPSPAAGDTPIQTILTGNASSFLLVGSTTIPAGSTSIGFEVVSDAVVPGGIATSMLAASLGGGSVSATLNVFDGGGGAVSGGGTAVDPDVPASVTETGLITFSDVDLSDMHLVSPNGTPVGTALGTLSAVIGTDTTGSSTGGAIVWTYSAPAAALQDLLPDETRIDRFTITLDDQHGSQITRTVEVALNSNGVEENHPIVIGVEDLTGTIPPVGPSELFTLTPLSTFTESGQVHFPFQLSLPSPAAGDTPIQTILTGNASSFLLVGSTTIPAGSTSIGFEVVSDAVVPGGIATSMLAASLGGGSVSATLNVFDGGGGVVSGGGTAVDPDVPASVTETGLITFSDVDLSDMHLVSPNGTPVGTALGTLSAVIGTDTTGSGTGGTIVWTYSAPAAALQGLLPDETRIDRFTITLDDQHGSQITRTIELALNTNGAPVVGTDGDAVTESGVNPGNTPFAGDPSAAGNVLANDTDVDAGDTMTVTTTGTFTGTYGSLTLAADGGWTYTLDNADPDTDALAQDAPAQDVFSYTIQDATGATSSSTLTINIAGSNDAPAISAPAVIMPVLEGVRHPSGTFTPDEVAHGVFRLTTNSAEIAGAVWSEVDLGTSFSLQTRVSFGADPAGADGIAFVIQSQGADALTELSATSGNAGGTLGIGGGLDPGLAGAFGIWIDSFGNVGFPVEAGGQSISFFENDGLGFTGLPSGAAPPFAFANTLENSQWHDLAIGWDALSSTLTFTFVHQPSGQTVTLAHQFDPSSLPAGQVYFGFSAATGLSTNEQQVQIVQFSADAGGLVTEDSHVNGLGQLTDRDVARFSDVDLSDTHDVSTAFLSSTSVAGQLGALAVSLTPDSTGTGSGFIHWDFAVDNAALNPLNVSDTITETWRITVTDSFGAASTRDLDIVIQGANDPAVITGTAFGTVREAGGVDNGTPGIPVFSGQLNVTDVDNPAIFIVQDNVPTAHGLFSVTETGLWTYQLNNDDPIVDALPALIPIDDTMLVQTADGTSHGISVFIVGANDAAVVSGPGFAPIVQEGGAPVTADALANATDVDSNLDFAEIVNLPALPPGVTFDSLTGTFLFDPANPFYDSLTEGEPASVTVNYGILDVPAIHGSHGLTTPASVVFQIVGVNDPPVAFNDANTASRDVHTPGFDLIGFPANGNVLDNDTDADNAYGPFGELVVAAIRTGAESGAGTPGTVGGILPGAYGTLSIGSNGVYIYSVDNDNGEVQGLGAGNSLFDTFTYTLSDPLGGTDTAELVIQIVSPLESIAPVALPVGNVDLSLIGVADTAHVGFQLIGDSDFGAAGIAVSSAGDFNNDGIGDLLIGAPEQGSGRAYVVYGTDGNQSILTFDLGNLALDPFSGLYLEGLFGADRLGNSVAALGDINGDGIDDILVGAPGDSGVPGDPSETGAAYVIYGYDGPGGTTYSPTQPDALPPALGFEISGLNAGDQIGVSVAAAGDVNGDGIGDILIGAPAASSGAGHTGEVYVVYGQAGTPASVDLNDVISGSAGFRISGPFDFSGFGSSVAGIGDINGDGVDDILVGAANSGIAYGIYGAAGGRASFGVVDPGVFAGVDLFIVIGNMVGQSAASAGDINGDGINDFAMGGLDAAYVVYGTGGNLDSVDTGSVGTTVGGFTIVSESAGDLAGYSVSAAGDINADGFGDLIVGAVGADSGTFAGAAYVIFGQGGLTGTIALSDIAANIGGFKISGAAGTDQAGFSVAAAGDVDNDGIDDIIVGAPYAGALDPGAAYVIYGANTTGIVTEDGAPTTTGQVQVTSTVGPPEVQPLSDVAGTWGTFSIAASGLWTYTLDQSNPLVQAFSRSTVETDTFTVTSASGSTNYDVTVTIRGSNDAPAAAPQLPISALEDNGSYLSDGLLFGTTDPDPGDTLWITFGALPVGVEFLPASLSPTGQDSFVFDSFDPAYDHLAAGETQTVTVDYGVTDGLATTAAALDFIVTGVDDGLFLSPDFKIALPQDSDPVALNLINSGPFAFDSDSPITITVTAVPDQGQMLQHPFYGGGAVGIGDVLTGDQLLNLRFAPGSTPGNSAFSFEVSDGVAPPVARTVFTQVVDNTPGSLNFIDGSGAYSTSGGRDILRGGGGDDTIDAQVGFNFDIFDHVAGGAGSDDFIIRYQGLTIEDFTPDEDHLQVSAADFSFGATLTVVTVADWASAVGGPDGYFIFDSDGFDGSALYWDATGDSSGADAIRLATLPGVITLLPSDFQIL